MYIALSLCIGLPATFLHSFLKRCLLLASAMCAILLARPTSPVICFGFQVAQKFKQEPAIFFPHDLDFRGRAYPMHPHLNHMGPDVCRGLLCFAEAKPLGEQGFNWLLVQVSARCCPLTQLCIFAFVVKVYHTTCQGVDTALIRRGRCHRCSCLGCFCEQQTCSPINDASTCVHAAGQLLGPRR